MKRFVTLSSILTVIVLSLLRPTPLIAHEDREITIASPPAGTILTPGQHVTVTVTTTTESKIRSVYIVGRSFFFSGVKSGPPFVFDMVVPEGVALRSSLVAVGSRKEGQLGKIESKAVPVDIQLADDSGCVLEEMSPKSFLPDFVGEQLSIGGVSVRCSDGTFVDVTDASATSFTSADSSVATADSHGMVTAVGPGHTTVSIRYKDQTKTLDVIVKASIRGDLDGNGRVTRNDLNILKGFVGMQATCPNDARDLNHDRRIDEEDVEIIQRLIAEQNEKGEDKDRSKHGDRNRDIDHDRNYRDKDRQ
jgi:hypothetical protein